MPVSEDLNSGRLQEEQEEQEEETGLLHEGVPQEFFFALSFDGHTPEGTVTFHDGFKADGPIEY